MTAPARSQPVLTDLTRAAIFAVLTIADGGEERVRELLGGFEALVAEVAALAPDGGLAAIVGVGSEAYDRIFGDVLGGTRPAHLHVLPEIVGSKHTAVSTPGDLLLHIRAAELGLCFEIESRVLDHLAGAATVVDEVQGFGYFDARNLMGFVDGTANPTGEEAAKAVVIAAEDPGFAGGSYVVVQVLLHDIDAWNALPVDEQERAVGRTKVDNVEFDDAIKPSNSHVAATTLLDATGQERQILRRNMVFGHPGAEEFGTYFIGYAADPGVTEQMLANMFVGRPPGNHDRILDFSTAVTGTLFFVPSLDLLATLAPEPVGAVGDNSLGIGSLKHLLGKVTS